MRKIFTFLLTLCILFSLSACKNHEGKLTWEYENNCAVFVLEEFSGTYRVKLERNDLDESGIYFRTNLTEGAVTVSYHMGGNTLVHDPEPLFAAVAGIPLDSHSGYIEDGTVSIIFETNTPVSGEITLSFVPFDDPTPPTNHFLRNQVGCEWMHEITAEDIAGIEMISKASGVAPGTLKYISSSTKNATIARIFEDYYWLDTTPIDREDAMFPGGSIFTVRFILKDGTTKELVFDNEAYFDGKGNVYKLLYIPTFNDVPEYTSCYGFVTYEGTGTVYDDKDNLVCAIPIDTLEFVETTAPAITVETDRYIETEFGNLMFIGNSVFYIEDKRDAYYQLVGLNLDELIGTYTERAAE